MDWTLIQSFVAFIGHALLACSVVLWLNRWARRPRVDRALVVGVVLALLVPVGGLLLAGYIRGVMGDLSIVSMVLLGAFVSDRLVDRPLLSQSSRSALRVGAVAGALVLYPLALGLGNFDPYRLGYRPLWLLAPLVLAVVLAWRSHRGCAVAILVGVTAFNLNLLESSNLWDYLLDVWLVIGATFWGAAVLWRTWRSFPPRSADAEGGDPRFDALVQNPPQGEEITSKIKKESG